MVCVSRSGVQVVSWCSVGVGPLLVYDKGSSRYRIIFFLTGRDRQNTRAGKENQIGSGSMPYLILHLAWVVSTASISK
jgi:hypothetical protein